MNILNDGVTLLDDIKQLEGKEIVYIRDNYYGDILIITRDKSLLYRTINTNYDFETDHQYLNEDELWDWFVRGYNNEEKAILFKYDILNSEVIDQRLRDIAEGKDTKTEEEKAAKRQRTMEYLEKHDLLNIKKSLPKIK